MQLVIVCELYSGMCLILTKLFLCVSVDGVLVCVHAPQKHVSSCLDKVLVKLSARSSLVP